MGISKRPAASGVPTSPLLLSGGNPQIPKGDGEAPVRAYLDAMPGWKRAVGERLDSVMCDRLKRVLAWRRLARDLDLAKLESMLNEVAFEDVVAAAPRMLAGKVRGRVIVPVGKG